MGTIQLDMIGEHRHVKAEGLVDSANTFEDERYQTRTGGSLVPQTFYTGFYGGPETKPVSCSYLATITY